MKESDRALVENNYLRRGYKMKKESRELEYKQENLGNGGRSY